MMGVPHCGTCGKTAVLCICGVVQSTPSPPPPGAPAPPRRAIIETRYGVRYCAVCGFPEPACGCDRQTTPDAPMDGAESSLNQRIRQQRGFP